jgi:hypothetical protein
VVIALLLFALVAIVGYRILDLRKDRGLTQPLRTMAGIYIGAFVLYVASSAYHLWLGFGGGPVGAVCVDTAFPFIGGAGSGHSARAGASISTIGSIHACALHPSSMQWLLFLLTRLPGMVLWGSLLLLVWRLVWAASRGGPFTAQTATAMQQLGWVVIGGTLLAGALGALGADLLTRMLMTPSTFAGGAIAVDILVAAPLRALLPLPALTGVILLSFARITKAGVVLDDEIKATV